jgi:transcriptional regulator with XRE-family HTH domain
MPSFINSTMKRIWRKMARKAYRDGYVGAHISNTIASQITILRAANGWTQTELADRARMKQSRISALEDPNWENVEVGTLRRLASAFDVGLTIRFIPFGELAQWAATLSEDKLLVPTYEKEVADETSPQPAAEPNVATAISAAPSLTGGVEFFSWPSARSEAPWSNPVQGLMAGGALQYGPFNQSAPVGGSELMALPAILGKLVSAEARNG